MSHPQAILGAEPARRGAASAALLVINVAAVGKATAARIEAYARARFPALEAVRSRTPETLWRSVERLRGVHGARLVVAGGDGTVHAAANALAGTSIELGIVPCGTGNDFARSLGLPRRPERALEVALGGAARSVDVGECRLAGAHGAALTCRFVNIAEAGLGAEVVRAARRWPRRFGRALAYQLAIVDAVARLRYASVSVSVDGVSAGVGPSANVIVGNGQYFGGGLRPFPWSRLDDGRLELGWMRRVSRFEILRRAPALRHGLPRDHREVIHGRGAVIAVDTSGAPVGVEADGELLGRLPAVFGVVPAALRVVCAAEAPAA